jgi:hypothetical protein
MRQLNIETIADTVTLSRKDKLLRWARLIRESVTDLIIYHELEYWSPGQRKQSLKSMVPGHESAFTLAAQDPIFAAMGLTNDPSLNDVTKFFELSKDEVHAFSCDCGGHLSKERMAERIEHLAKSPVARAFASWR